MEPGDRRLLTEVYFNLHKRVFSIRQRGRVVDHARSVVLSGCTFVVQPAGQRRVRETGVKNVHAFVKGTLVEENHEQPYIATAWRLRYNPFTGDDFVVVGDTSEVSVSGAQLVLCEITEARTPIMWAWGPQRKE